MLERCCKGSAFFANMQALCAFAHAVEVFIRENQRVRRRIVHSEGKDLSNTLYNNAAKNRECKGMKMDVLHNKN